MRLKDFLGRLKAVHRSGNGWMARCPAHPDKNPSLSVREEKGKILIHCFGGCAPESVCNAAGITMRELFSETDISRKREPSALHLVRPQINGLRSRLTGRDQDLPVTVVIANRANPDVGFAWALALAVEGELVQVVFAEGEE
jgi:CHC2 zinc finger